MPKGHFIFDVDGTLTPSRGKIDPQFEEWFKQFITLNTVCLVTGSDRLKTIEQIGEMLFNMCICHITVQAMMYIDLVSLIENLIGN